MPLLSDFDFPALRSSLAELGADGWLLFDFHGVNPVPGNVLGLAPGLATRRLFVWLPRAGAPVAVAHKIELGRLAGFPGEIRPYAAWRELHEELRRLVAGKTAAMEVSPRDNVPYLDRVPHGVVELVESLGGRVISSAVLVTRFAARWSPAELEGHRRAAESIATIAQEAIHWAGSETARGTEVRETAVQRRVLEQFERAGLVTDNPPIVGFQANSANPHYEPVTGADRGLAAGDVILLDLWAGPAKGTVFADQTWMGFAGSEPEKEVGRVWDTVRRARDAAVELLKARWGGRQNGPATAVTGGDLDDAARTVIRDAGYGEWFVHRTGHSIDRDLHGSGPHLDNFETGDDRRLVSGIGFSVEPGIYLPGRFGVRSEINVFLAETGPEVTPRAPQQDLILV
jgi:Xaa-Pro aminopeptidase